MFSALNIRIGFFLAKRQIKRSNPWTTVLIIFVMFFTFLNLVVVSGILVGLIQGAVDAVREILLVRRRNLVGLEIFPAMLIAHPATGDDRHLQIRSPKFSITHGALYWVGTGSSSFSS